MTSGDTAAFAPLSPYAHIKRGGILRLAWSGETPSLDPFTTISFQAKTLAGFVYSRLYRIGARADLNPNSALPVGDLAESAESVDGQTWLVRLRRGAQFQDVPPVNGRAVSAEDVLSSWRRLTAKESPNAAQVRGVVRVEAVDDATLRFDLDAPTATFLDLLADANLLWVLPAEAGRSFDPARTAIGSGPWMLTNLQPGVALEFRRHGGYFVEGQPFVDGVHVSLAPEYESRLARFEAARTHVEGIQSEDVQALRSAQPSVQWRGVQPALLSFVFFSPRDRDPSAPWRDERFRQAVSMSMNRDALTELGYNVAAFRAAKLDVATTWSNLVPAGFTRWWLDPRSKDQGATSRFFQHDPSEARKLLEATGAAGAAIPFQYPGNRYGRTFNAIAEATADGLAQIGLRPAVESQDYANRYLPRTFNGDFTGIAFGYETPFPEVGGYFARLFGDDPANHGRVRDARITELDQKQRVELDERRRRELIWEIQRINAQRMYYVPSQAGAGTSWTAYRPELRGIVQTRGYGTGTEALLHFWLDL